MVVIIEIDPPIIRFNDTTRDPRARDPLALGD
jgi:hypothetical protein